jgi:GTP-binding protein
MALSQLPKFTYCPPSLYNTHINLPLLAKLKLPTLTRLKSTLTTTEPIPITEAHNFLTPQEETRTQFSLDKLFIPPDTEVSINENSGLSARILKGSNIVLSKYARDAQVVQAEFIKSSVRTEDCPSDGLPEFALVGRSNVGKSSLLNSLVRRKKLALTSKKPGQFIINLILFFLTDSCLLLCYVINFAARNDGIFYLLWHLCCD